MKFLIVDNAPAIRMALGRHLREAEPLCEIREADTNGTALAAMEGWRPNIVFTGMGLAHGEKGLPLVQEILRRDATQTVVICTSMPKDHADVAQALSDGAFAYLAKPVRGDPVKHILNEYSMERGGLRRIR